MDKHERKRLARWESKTGREALEIEKLMRKHSFPHAYRHIARVVSEWEPVQELVYSKALRLLSEPQFLLIQRGNLDFSDHDIQRLVMGFQLITSSRVRMFLTDEDIANEIAIEKSLKQMVRVYQLAFAIRRHQSRVYAIRAELLARTVRLRAIQNCYLIKQELMMEAWHPKRVGHILTTYGWEAYENLLGEE